MKQINLKKILDENYHFILSPNEEKCILAGMKKAVYDAIDLCAEEAEADYTYIGDSEIITDYPEDIEVYVLKESILKVKDLIK